MATRLLWFVASCVFFVPAQVDAQGVEIVEIERPQIGRSPAAVVHDPAGLPMPGVFVEEFSSDWKTSLRSTKTDAKGAFTFAPVKGRDVYYFQLTSKNFNPLRVRIKLDRKRGKKLQLQMELST